MRLKKQIINLFVIFLILFNIFGYNTANAVGDDLTNISSEKESIEEKNGEKERKEIFSESNEQTDSKGIEYFVKSGDTLNKISSEVGVEPEWIIDSNLGIIHKKINKDSTGFAIEGQKILIPLKKGIAYKVQSGEDKQGIINSFGASNEEFASLNGNSEIREGEIIILPSLKNDEDIKPKKRNTFPWGQCTWYAASKAEGQVTWRGNANRWLYNSKIAGELTGDEPIEGSIIQMGGRGMPLGHVGYVEEVKENHIVISEMNYKGLGIKNYRVLKKGHHSIKGFIYVGKSKNTYLNKSIEEKIIKTNIENSEIIVWKNKDIEIDFN